MSGTRKESWQLAARSWLNGSETCQPPAASSLTDPFSIGDVRIENRVLLAPLAGIGSWFVRLQARRHGAGLAVSEMVSSHAIARGNRRTLVEMLRIHPDEHPVSVQLFGPDPEVMRGAAATVAEAGADLVDINMGCPVPKIVKTGAGAALLAEPDRAIAVARAAGEGSGLPVTVKLRSGLEPGDRSGLELAVRLADEVGVAAIAFHPRPASTHHKGRPDYALVRELRARVAAPVIVSGGLRRAEEARRAFELSGADAVMIARGALGYPWVFEELTGRRSSPPTDAEIVAELEWVLDGGVRHWGPERAARNLRKFYPWYLERLGIAGPAADAYQRTERVDDVRAMLADVVARPPAAPARGREYASL
jgi:tRNA-dihydrouridine synthase B